MSVTGATWQWGEITPMQTQTAKKEPKQGLSFCYSIWNVKKKKSFGVIFALMSTSCLWKSVNTSYLDQYIRRVSMHIPCWFVSNSTNHGNLILAHLPSWSLSCKKYSVSQVETLNLLSCLRSVSEEKVTSGEACTFFFVFSINSSEVGKNKNRIALNRQLL